MYSVDLLVLCMTSHDSSTLFCAYKQYTVIAALMTLYKMQSRQYLSKTSIKHLIIMTKSLTIHTIILLSCTLYQICPATCMFNTTDLQLRTTVCI